MPCRPIYSIDQTFNDPQVQLLNQTPSVTHHALGEIKLLGQAVNMSRSKSSPRMPAPDLGQHSELILGRLGLSRAHIADLKKRHVV